MSPSARVLDFKAVGDGRTDDGPAIQKAIDSLPEAGGTVFFPRDSTRTFRIGPRTVLVRAGITLAAETRPGDPPPSSGARSSSETPLVFRDPGDAHPMFEVAGDDVRFENLRFKVRIGLADDPGVPLHKKPGNHKTCIKAIGHQRISLYRCFVEFEPLDGTDFWGYTNQAVLAQNYRGVSVVLCDFLRCQLKCGGALGGIQGVLVERNRFVSPHNFALSVVGRREGVSIEGIRVIRNEAIDLNEGGVYIGDDAEPGQVEDPLGRVQILNVQVIENHFGGEWRSTPEGTTGGECKGVFIRPGIHNRDIQIRGNAFASTVRAKGSFGVFCSPHARSFARTFESFAIEENVIQMTDNAGIAVAGGCDSLRIVGNKLTDTRGAKLFGTEEGGAHGMIRENDFGGIPDGEPWLHLIAKRGPLGPLSIRDIPARRIRIEGSHHVEIHADS
ncbi:MAG: hypothetical protein IT434_05305 [Phycisphaerales bacterium]|jgi:hypothetical protein|nr:hypothetical protein [Phycisphaerales bacterium]